MSRENIAASQRVLEEGFNQGNLDAIDEVCSEGYVDHDPLMGDSDREGLKQTIKGYREAFPDIHITIDEIFAAGDRVVTRWTGEGTFQNPMMGLQPTGQRGAPIHGIGIDRFEEGKVVESWGQWDTMQFMKNIGAVPEGAAAGAGS
jgi:predicted ester cyclase